MASITTATDGSLEAAFRQAIQKAMNEAAEPIIKQAVADAELEMRRRLGSSVLALLEKGYSIERFGTELRILVRIDKP